MCVLFSLIYSLRKRGSEKGTKSIPCSPGQRWSWNLRISLPCLPSPCSLSSLRVGWLFREMKMTTRTASLAAQRKDLSSFLITGPSTSRLQTISRLPSSHSRPHSHVFPTALRPNALPALPRTHVLWGFAHSPLPARARAPWLSTWAAPTGPADAAKTPPPPSIR